VVAAWLKHEGLVIDAMRIAANISDSKRAVESGVPFFSHSPFSITLPSSDQPVSFIRSALFLPFPLLSSFNILQTYALIPRLQEALSRVRGGIILRHQEQQLNTAIEEEIDIATRRRSSEIRAHLMAKEASYKDILFRQHNRTRGR
jgi:hypothetical protein